MCERAQQSDDDKFSGISVHLLMMLLEPFLLMTVVLDTQKLQTITGMNFNLAIKTNKQKKNRLQVSLNAPRYVVLVWPCD